MKQTTKIYRLQLKKSLRGYKMKSILKNIKGDKAIWAVAGLLALFSFLPVYSASSNLAYLYDDGNASKYLINHFAHLVLGFLQIQKDF